MRRVLFVVTSLDVGGAEMMLYKLISRLLSTGIKVAVVCLRNPGPVSKQLEELSVPVWHLNIKRFLFSPKLINNVIKIVRQFRPNVLQGWMYHGNFIAWLLQHTLFPKAKLAWGIRQSLHSLKNEKYNTRIIIRFCAKVSGSIDSIIYNSEKSCEDHDLLGYASHKSIMIDNGFDTEIFCPNPDMRSVVRRELDIPSDAKLIGLINRYHAVKGHDVFFYAASQICDKRKDVYFILAGRDVDDLNPRLSSWLAKPHLMKRVRLLGERRDIPKLMAALDIASCTSLWGEGFPNVVGEAMSCGIPVVGTDVGDTKRVIGNSGIIVPPNDYISLAKAWETILDKPTVERKELGIIGRQRAETLFSLDVIANKYIELYNEI